MKINELNPIKTIDLTHALDETKAGSGTFKNILDKVMDGTIIPLVENDTIVGISYDAKANTIVDDNIAERRFEKAYSGKPIMEWVLQALYVKAMGREIDQVVETNKEIRVDFKDNGCFYITGCGDALTGNCDKEEKESVRNSLEDPNKCSFDFEDLECEGFEVDNDNDCLKFLRDKYQRFLSGKVAKPEIIRDYEEGVISFYNINWGRKKY